MPVTPPTVFPGPLPVLGARLLPSTAQILLIIDLMPTPVSSGTNSQGNTVRLTSFRTRAHTPSVLAPRPSLDGG